MWVVPWWVKVMLMGCSAAFGGWDDGDADGDGMVLSAMSCRMAGGLEVMFGVGRV